MTGVKTDKFALGYFGYSYFDQNRDSLNIVKIAAGDDISKAIEPTKETIENGTYTPLARPVFIYVNKKALERKEVIEFVRFYLSDEGQSLVSKAHCINMSADSLKQQRSKFEQAIGSSSTLLPTDRGRLISTD